MLKFLIFVALISMGMTGRRYYGVEKKSSWRRLLKSLTNNVFATCEMVLYTTPENYENAGKQCTKFKIGVKSKISNLVTLDSKNKTGHLEFLFDEGIPFEKRTQDDGRTWIWTGLQKVINTEIKGKKKRAVKLYNPSEWEWVGTGKSPTDYSKFPKRGKNKQPDQLYMKKKRTNSCKEKPGCFQNQVKVGDDSSWDDAWAFEEHPFACDYRGKYILSAEVLTWDKAKVACAKAGLELAMVRNLKEVKEMMLAIEYFLGPGNDTWETFDAQNWVWLGGNDLKKEGRFRWLNGKLVETWDIPWIVKAGQDNASYLKDTDGQHAIAFSRQGKFDDSYHKHKKRERAFACQCPGS